MANKKSYSVGQILSWKFHEKPMPKVWSDHIGDLDDRFTIYVDGEAGNGKTEYVLQFAKMGAIHLGKVRLNNVEQGKHRQIKNSIVRNDFKGTIPAGKFQYDNIRSFEQYLEKISKPSSGAIQIIDSISYFPLKAKEIQYLFDTFKNKSFLIVAYAADYGKNAAIRHLCDTKVRVNNYIAEVEGSRFGGGKPYSVWPERHQIISQPDLFSGKEVGNG